MSFFTMGAGLLVILLVRAAFGVACMLIAQSRGRSAVAWFLIGFFVTCIGVVIVLVLPDLKVQEERERRLADENRRLREKLRKDRMVADERHAEVARRLGAHDVALGVDTAGAPIGALPGAAPPPPPTEPTAPSPFAAAHREAVWYWARGTNRDGPLSFADLQGHWRTGTVRPETLVWKKGMTQWVAVGEVPGLAETLDA